MTVNQISAFVENTPGSLERFTEVLNRNQIDMRALSVAETETFGVVRVIVNDSYKAACVLKEENYILSVTAVLAVELPDTPGGLYQILRTLREADINVEYMYAFTARRKDVAYMIFRVTDNEKAIEALNSRGIRLLTQNELEAM
ncbi:MAG TPA: acetolactate synthase [Ruminococcaceae bacterium]|nr:acetolactate synthase [Oscillospiraceae bacterium]